MKNSSKFFWKNLRFNLLTLFTERNILINKEEDGGR